MGEVSPWRNVLDEPSCFKFEELHVGCGNQSAYENENEVENGGGQGEDRALSSPLLLLVGEHHQPYMVFHPHISAENCSFWNPEVCFAYLTPGLTHGPQQIRQGWVML